MDPVADRLQFDMQEIRNRLAILEATILQTTSLNVPAPEVAPVVHPAPQSPVVHEAPESLTLPVTAIPDISVGWIASGRK
jgi:hypothetical protein